MVFRSLTLEPLDDGEGGLATKPEPVKRGLFGRTKEAVTRSNSAKAEAALSFLRKVIDCKDAVIAKQKAKQHAIQEVLNEFQSAGVAFDINNIDAYKESLRKWALAQGAIQPLKGLSMDAVREPYQDPNCVSQLKLEFGDLKGPLITVCQFRIGEQTAILERLTSEWQEKLGPKYDGADAPPVKEQALKVEHLKGMLGRIQNDQNLPEYFINFASQLLSADE